MKANFDLARTLEGCRRQDGAAQRQLYEHYYAYGLTICLHYAGHREAAEEILHDGFLKVFAKVKAYRAESEFKYWFRQIMVRSAIDAYRKTKRRREREADIIQLAPELNTQNLALEKLSRDDVLRCLQQLPPSYRMVTTLYLLEGYTHKEIAKELGISEGTSKSNYAKARQKLARYVNRFFSSIPLSI